MYLLQPKYFQSKNSTDNQINEQPLTASAALPERRHLAGFISSQQAKQLAVSEIRQALFRLLLLLLPKNHHHEKSCNQLER